MMSPTPSRRSVLALLVASHVPLVPAYQAARFFGCVPRTLRVPRIGTTSDIVYAMSMRRPIRSGHKHHNAHWFSPLFAAKGPAEGPDISSETELSPIDQNEHPSDLGDVPIPSTGVSVTDELEQAQADRFISDFVPIKGLPGVAQIVTFASKSSVDPVRYLVSLSPPSRLPPAEQSSGSPVEPSSLTMMQQRFVLTDVPPYSEKLALKMREFMGPDAKLAAILVTSRDAIHYDEAPAVFTTRKSDINKWTAAFPGVEIVVYRLDVPRDCREVVTQRLDGYGPWALQESVGENEPHNVTFVETGRPLTYMEWDDETVANVFDKGETPPDVSETMGDDENYTPEAIRVREQGKRVLALHTPGHTFGSLTYVFPEAEVCCSGFTIPVEDTRAEENYGIDSAAPVLDCRGYITTSKAGMARQMESARHVINTYADRFTVVLPARGDPLFLDGDVDERKETLLDIADQYDKIGKIYEQLGITQRDES